ncbi:MAG: tetratricopeptide repeat protein [Gemmatimonadaceae bacterium]
MTIRVFAIFGLASLLTVYAAGAQGTDTTVAPLARAEQLRNSGDFAQAAGILRQLLASEPGNGDAARLLAQTLYWLGDVPGATAVYERAIATHPHDTAVRLDYAQMLVETRNDARAAAILEPLIANRDTRGRAATLAGTMLYWQGDLARAATRFRMALAADPDEADARRQLDEIRAMSAPWITIGAGGLNDDQPLDRIEGEVEAGLFINPLLSVAARVRPRRFDIGTPDTYDVVAGEVELSHFAPAARLETRLAAGGVNHSAGDGSRTWTGRGQLRFRLPNHLSVEARGERAPYLWTAASIENPVMTETGTVAAALNRPDGWLGEGGVRREQFPDQNSVTSAYAWLLAPVLRTPQARASIGYSVASQDAKETRFNGRYDPYYTPEGIVSHSALASIALLPTPRTTITARGALGFHATERAPRLIASGAWIGAYDLVFEQRSFTPWDAHLTFSGAVSDAVTLSASVDRMQTAFYAATSGSVRLSYRFLPARHR